MLQNLPTAVLFIENRKIVYANSATEQIYGYSAKDLIGKETRLLYRTDAEYEATGKQIYSMLEKVNIHKGIYPFRHKNGSDIVCETKVVKMENFSEKRSIVVTFEDITERIAAEKELAESEEKYKNLLENTHDIITSISPDGRIIHANSAWYRTFGYTEQESSTLTVEDIIQSASLPTFQEQFAKALNNEPTKNLSISFQTKSGEAVVLEGNLIPKSFYNKIIAVWGLYRDITEQKRAQGVIQDKIVELEKFNKIVVDRELKMIELKDKIKKLQDQITNFAGSRESISSKPI